MILAKFTVQNSLGVSGINFQAAVPKVCGVFLKLSQSKNADIDYETIVTTVADASYVKYECGTWSDRDSADADYGARWCKSLFLKNKNLDFLIYIYIYIYLRALYDYDCASVILLLDKLYKIK